MDTYEFGSPEWIEAVRRELADGLAGQDLRGIEYTMSEEYTSPPEHLRPGSSATIGWHLRIAGGEAMVGDAPVDGADFAVVGDYTSLLQSLVHVVHSDSGPTPETQRIVADLVSAGRLRIHGDRSRMPAALVQVNLHNRVARRTV